jgi:two-component system, response regulator PdtaR
MSWVLIAESDDVLRAQLADALSDRGYDVETTSSGDEVSRVLDSAAEMPAVIVLDLLLARVSGVEVIRAIRSGLGRARHVPIIVLSGTSLYDNELLDLDVDAIFVKPVAANTLFLAIDRAIDTSSTRAGRGS